MKKYLSLLIGIAVLAVGCNDSEDDEPSTSGSPTQLNIEETEILATDSVSMKNLIDSGAERTWSTSAFTLAGSTAFQSCRLDDEMEFNSDGTYTYRAGQTCGAEDNQEVRVGTWEVDFDNKTCIFDKGSSREVTATVIGLSEDEIRLSGSYMMMEIRGIFTRN
ncbi:MAG: lipocalin family protein [Bacteroidota bacterium]